ncbi:MAG: DUF1080 domain-containing protein [Bacteroidales bacterium]|nr:DUF1080 domain-containing protein [Bacteroidales bacterium]
MRSSIITLLFFMILTGCSSARMHSHRFQLPEQEKKEGFRVLFDGTNMARWTSNTNEYILQDGCIVMQPTDGHGNLYTVEEFDNFVLRFEFQLTPESNSGLGIRHKMITAPRGYDGMELQILDNSAPIYEKLKPYQYHGSLYGWIPAKRGFLKPVGEWNYQEVVADGDNIKITLNGTVILDGNLKEATKDVPTEKVPKTLFYEKGHIAFLGHNSVVKFRNIRIKELE